MKLQELEAQESALRANGGSDEHFASAQRGLEAAECYKLLVS